MSAASLKALMLKKIEEAKHSSFFNIYSLGDLATNTPVTQKQICVAVRQFVDSFSIDKHDTVLQPDTFAKAQFDTLYQAWDNQRHSITLYKDEISGLLDIISDYRIQVVTLKDQAKVASDQLRVRTDAHILTCHTRNGLESDVALQANRIAQLETQLAEQVEANLKMANECHTLRENYLAADAARVRANKRLRGICDLTRGY